MEPPSTEQRRSVNYAQFVVCAISLAALLLVFAFPPYEICGQFLCGSDYFWFLSAPKAPPPPVSEYDYTLDGMFLLWEVVTIVWHTVTACVLLSRRTGTFTAFWTMASSVIFGFALFVILSLVGGFGSAAHLIWMAPVVACGSHLVIGFRRPLRRS